MNLFLIDADNLNAEAWVDEAFRVLLAQEGPLPVRRAYGSAENLKSLADVLRTWAVRPFVNLSLTKNTTDIALAVDAMALACQHPRPASVIIGSGDADFLPLVVRLRELGIRVVCVSERSKMGREALPAYDRVVLVGQAPALELTEPPSTSTKTRVTKKSSSVKSPAKKQAVKTTTEKVTSAKKPATKKAAVQHTEPPQGVADTVPSSAPDVAAILLVVPALQSGQPQALAAVAKALLDAKLRGKNMTVTKLLKKFPRHFVLLPPEKPRTVTYTPTQEPA